MTELSIKILLILPVILVVAFCLWLGTKASFRWVDTKGRMTRRLFIPLYCISAGMGLAAVLAISEALTLQSLPLLLVMLIALGIFIAINMASFIKRGHDFGLPSLASAFLSMASLTAGVYGTWVAWIVFGIVFVAAIWPGQIGSNAYGPNPRQN